MFGRFTRKYNSFRSSFLSIVGVTAIALHVHGPVAFAGEGECGHATNGRQDSLQQMIRPQPELKWHSMFSNLPKDWARYVSVTFRPDKTPAFLGMAGLTAGLMFTDPETWKLSNRWYQNSPTVQTVSDFFEYLGDGRPQFGLAAGFAVWGFAAADHRAVRTASQLVEAILACGVVVQTIKHVTGRESPYLSTQPAGRWDFFPNQIEYHKRVPAYDAYPSGHIATALATVTVVAENYPEWVWVKPVGYTIVALIGISMANTGIHWYSDYPLGLSFGYAFGMLAAHPEGLPAEVDESGQAHLHVAPMVGERGNGVTISLMF